MADFAERWGVGIVWVERDGSQPSGARFRETDYEHASRAGEPFAELITERRYVPNAVTRFCTQALKIETARDYMRAQGYERWTSVVGLRRDEHGQRHDRPRSGDLPGLPVSPARRPAER